MPPLPTGGQALRLLTLAAGLAGASGSTSGTPADVTVAALTTEYAVDPVGIDAAAPRLGWQLRATRRGVVQSAYQIQVAESEAALRGSRGILWDSGRIDSDQSVHVAYGGPALSSGTRYFWRVRVWDGEGAVTPWSAAAFWEMGLLHASDWTAAWVEPALDEDTAAANPAPMLRGSFTVRGPVASARLYVTSHGLNQPVLNGSVVGDRLFTPGWTSYGQRLQYETYDVGSLLRPGENVLGALLGDGWYRGRIGWVHSVNVYGARLALLAQLVIRYADGGVETVGTDATWRAATGPILASTIYDGEIYDARLERRGWDAPGHEDGDWAPVRVVDAPKEILVAPAGPPVRRIEELRPVGVFVTPQGDTVVDMGQNMVGWVRLAVEGPSGTTVTLRHAEVLDAAGNVYTANLRDARATVQYTLRGGEAERFEPHFTFMGFRYVAVSGYPRMVTPDDLTGIVIHSDMEPTGTFETSDSMIDRLQHNIRWGQKGNFLDVPTDTPARDERLGWTGDAQAFAPTAAFNFQVLGFFTKWLADVSADQGADGSVPWVVPDVVGRGAAAGWGDVATIAPWALYLAYGDPEILRRQYPSMRAWVEFIRSRAGTDLIWSEDDTFGDWLAFHSDAADYPGATTDKDLIATAFFAHSTDLLAKAAALLGKADDAAEYGALFTRIRAAFGHEFVTPSGRLASDTQTAYALALEYDLLPDALRAEAGRRLAADVARFGHLTTGFLGTPLLLPALQRAGRIDLAYKLLLRREYPSWLYPITRGATTMWERWDGIRPDGTFQEVSMNSFNHYAYGAVGAWMYATVAGLDLDPAEPGYRHVVVRPMPGGGLTRARATLRTSYGEAASGWEQRGDSLVVTARIPPNTHGTVRLPGAALASVTERGQPLSRAAGVTDAREDGPDAVLEVGSGDYRFAWPTARRDE